MAEKKVVKIRLMVTGEKIQTEGKIIMETMAEKIMEMPAKVQIEEKTKMEIKDKLSVKNQNPMGDVSKLVIAPALLAQRVSRLLVLKVVKSDANEINFD